MDHTQGYARNKLSIKSSNAGGISDVYTYDTLNRLNTVTDASGPTQYRYDGVGNLDFTFYPMVSTSYGYDMLNRLTAMSAGAARYNYTLGAARNRLSVAELSGRTVNYGYDSLYRLTSEAITADPNGKNGTVSYAYDSVGNRQQMNSTLSAIPAGLFFYNADDQLSTDTYDANGNTISSAGIQDSYDFENHLIQKGAVTVVYDGDGNRVAETVGGVTTQYLVDTQNQTGYAQVVDELQNGVVARTYSYGMERISETQPLNGTSTTSFYGYDGHGSVRQLFDGTGAITDTYDYDAFGNLVNCTGSTPNNYLFAGEQFDPALNLYFNRARYLNATTGRFWTVDPLRGKINNPLSLHRYSFVAQNPVNKADPSGLDFDLGSTELAGAEEAQLGAEDLTVVSKLIESAYVPEAVAEAPQTFSALQQGIAYLLIGTAALGVGTAVSQPGSLPDEANADSQNYDIYRFGNAQQTARIRQGADYDVSSKGLIPAQNPASGQYKGASAYRNPYIVGLSGVVWRVSFEAVADTAGLGIIADGKDTLSGSTLPVGHHTIYPTLEMSPGDFQSSIDSLGWVRAPGRVQ